MKNLYLRFLAFGIVLLPLSGCGFTPIYGTNASISGAGVGPVTISTIDGRMGFFLQQSLARHAGLEQSASAPRKLEVKLTQNFNNVSLRPDSFTTRTRMSVTADYILAADDTHKEARGTVISVVSYDSVNQAYSEVSLQADAEERAANDLSNRIWADIINKSRPTR